MSNLLLEHIEDLTKLLQKQKIGDVLKKMRDFTISGSAERRNAITIFSSRWSEIQHKDALDLSTREDIKVETHNLMMDLLKFFESERTRIEMQETEHGEELTKSQGTGRSSQKKLNWQETTESMNVGKELRNAMSDLYDDMGEVKMVAEDIGVDLGRINTTGTVEMAWREVIKEADKQSLTMELVVYGLSDYGDDARLKAIKAFLEGSPIVPDPPPDPPPVIPRTDEVQKAKVFFSYAWGDSREEGESREKIVNDLYDSLETDGIDVIRDKRDLSYGGLISKFMTDIGSGDLIIVFISDKYLRSQYCMHELMEIYRNTRGDRVEFAERVLPVAVERVKLSDPMVLGKYLDHWKEEYKKWEDFTSQRLSDLGESQTDQFHRIRKIKQNFGDLTDYLRDINSSSRDLLSQGDFALVKDAIRSRLDT